jgi:hypothetical protein
MIKDNPAIAAFKVWVFPSLVSVVSLMIWNDVNEIKADVKALMAQSNIDKTRIDNLERQVYGKQVSNDLPNDNNKSLVYNEMYAVLPSNSGIQKYKPKKRII